MYYLYHDPSPGQEKVPLKLRTWQEVPGGGRGPNRAVEGHAAYSGFHPISYTGVLIGANSAILALLKGNGGDLT
jgi:hypothetical protein